MSYTMYTPLNVWLDPASVTDVVAYIQTYLSENTIYSETEIETIIHDYLIAHPELIGGVQSVNGKTGTVVLSASDINTENNVTIESVLASLSSQISSIAASVATNTTNITNLTGRMTTAETDLTNLKSNIDLTRLLNFGVLNLLDYVVLEKGRFDTNTGNKVASDTQARNASPLSLPVGTVINLLPIIGTGINIYNYNTDGTYIGRTPISDIPADGSYYYTTTAPVINFAFYINGNTLDEAYNAFKMTITTPSVYNEKRLSILGNSISSYRNMGLANAGFYPSGNVYTSGQLYWAQVKSALHLTLDTLNAYSQTMVSGDDNSMSMTTRGTNLGTPDIILFEGGTNDIYGNIASGQWEGDNVLDLSASLSATWSQGRIDGTTGTDRDSTTIIRTALIPVSVGEPLVFYTNEVVANAYIYKYGADDSYNGYDSFPINTNNGYKYKYTPTSAKIRICLANSDYSAIDTTFAGNLTVKLPYASEFIPAYTKAIRQIQTKYPNAKLICISPAFIEKNSTGREYCTIENIQRICEDEKLVCEYLGVPFIDCRKLKMNPSNIGSYTVDGLHWNYQFHSAVASAIIKELT